MKTLLLSLLAVSPPSVAQPAAAQSGGEVRPDAALLRFPDVSRTDIAFRYDGDVWLVPREGGVARRLSSPPGNESLPRFSPDGRHLAVVAGYEGGSDLYVLDVDGRELPRRVTYHPDGETLCDWTPDGEELIFFSGRESGAPRVSRLYRIPAAGGAAEALPVPYGAFGTIDPTGTWLAYTPRTREFRTWKRYQGGMAQDVWLFHLETFESRRITDHPGTDALPMWHGRSVIFLSDRHPSGRLNLYRHDPDSGETTQLTDFSEWDVKFPSIGPEDVVFENGGSLYLLPLAGGEARRVEVLLPDDREQLRPQRHELARSVASADLSPSARRVVLEARGELFSVPVEEGVTRSLTRTSGVAERFPAWSPDGRWIAYLADTDGEYDLWIRQSDGAAFTFGDSTDEVRAHKVASLGPGWRSELSWSPDSTKLTFQQSDGSLRLVEVASGRVSTLAVEPVGAPSASWAPDSNWLAWARMAPGTMTPVLVLHDLSSGSDHQVTSEQFAASDPVFDRSGDWLYFTSSRTFEPSYSDLDNSWVYTNSTNLVAVPLRADVENPWAPENVEEEWKDEEEDSSEGQADGPAEGEGEGAASGEGAGSEEEADEAEADEQAEPLRIDLQGFESRAILLPVAPGRIGSLAAAEGRVVYLRRPRTGSGEEASKLQMYVLADEEEKTILEGPIGGYSLAAGADKVLVAQRGAFAVVDLAPGQAMKEPLDLGGLVAEIEPRAEWRQLVHEAYRLMRDLFYDPGMHGVDWAGVRDRYLAALADATSRDDVHYLLGEMIGELNVGHAYNSPPDSGMQSAPDGPAAGLLGVDWEHVDGAWRIARMVGGGEYDYDARGPLQRFDLDVRVGDWLLEVNGVPVDGSREVHAALLGTAGEPTELVLCQSPTRDGSERTVVVEPLRSDRALRYRDWVADRRARVTELSGGRVGYVHVPDTGVNGQTELVRQFQGQYHTEALLVDERWNGGGQVPDRFIELLDRPVRNAWALRNTELSWPVGVHAGPKAMLINESAGSGGDLFPYYFRQSGLGPLIGTRTWGGLVGIGGSPSFIDGGNISVPNFAFFELDGTWGVEGHGVEPDIEVLDDPTLMARGADPQLEVGVDTLLRALEQHDGARPARPGGPQRAGSGIAPEDR